MLRDNLVLTSSYFEDIFGDIFGVSGEYFRGGFRNFGDFLSLTRMGGTLSFGPVSKSSYFQWIPRPPFSRFARRAVTWGYSSSITVWTEHPGPKALLVRQLYPRQHAERSEKTGVWGRIPQEVTLQ
jgi:hypothetical protein